MQTKAIIYLSFILMGFTVSQVLPFTDVLGVGFSILFSAMFLPYFGWKKIFKINVVLFLIAFTLSVTSLMASWDVACKSVYLLVEMGLMKEDVYNKAVGVTQNPLTAIPLFGALLLFERFVMIFSVNRALRKVGFFKRINF